MRQFIPSDDRVALLCLDVSVCLFGHLLVDTWLACVSVVVVVSKAAMDVHVLLKIFQCFPRHLESNVSPL